MKYIFDPEEEDVEPRQRSGATERAADADREITLGTRSLLGIFFGLVLICGIFFGLGYSVGRGSTPRTADLADVPAAGAQGGNPGAKPSAQANLTGVPPAATPQENAADQNTPGSAPQPGTAPPVQMDAGGAAQQTTGGPSSAETNPSAAALSGTPRPAATAGTPPKPAVAASSPVPAARPRSKAPTASAPAARPAAVFAPTGSSQKPPAAVLAATSQAPATESTGFMVQVAAVSVPQNAEILIGALEKHGFHATARREPQDTLLHVELGPFSTRAEANSTRSQLLADGYNGVVK